MIQKICAFTGHRPPRIPGGHDEESPAFRQLYAAIEAAIRQAVAEGYTVFRSGGAMGFDLWCAEAVLRIQKERAHMMIAYFDGKPAGGTAYTVSHAKKEGLPVWNLFTNANQTQGAATGRAVIRP